MSAQTKTPAVLGEDVETPTCVLRVPCPGKAHVTGEECMICDEENDGTISVVVTELELEALGCAAQGRSVDLRLSPRLLALGLLHEVAGIVAPTEKGYVLLGLGGPSARPN
jgi:hypothetical protein